MGVYPVAVYYNKTQHTNNTPHSNTAHKTTQKIEDTLHTMNTMQIQLQLKQIFVKRGLCVYYYIAMVAIVHKYPKLYINYIQCIHHKRRLKLLYILYIVLKFVCVLSLYIWVV
jgi:hypothetical protein